MNYAAYASQVRNNWDDLLQRVHKAIALGVVLPFSDVTFEKDYAIAWGQIEVILNATFYISDDDYDALRASHAKCNAYNDALIKAAPAALREQLGVPPDSTKIPEPPETLGDKLGEAAKVAKDTTIAIAIGGALIIGVSVFMSRGKKGGST